MRGWAEMDSFTSAGREVFALTTHTKSAAKLQADAWGKKTSHTGPISPFCVPIDPVRSQ